MRISFAVRLGATITILTAASTGAVTGLLYYTVSGETWQEMRAHVQALAHTGTYAFSPEDREAIARLAAELRKKPALQMPPVPGETSPGLEPHEIQQLQSSQDFQRVAQRLRRLKLASSPSARPDGILGQKVSDSPVPIRFAYLLAPLQSSADFSFVQFIADGDYEDFDENGDGKIQDDEVATTIGEVYNVVPQEGLRAAMLGAPASNRAYTEDRWGIWISGFAPVFGRDGRVIAVLGIDYAARGEFDKLVALRNFCLGIVAASFVLSIIVSIVISRWFTKPVQSLKHGTERFSAGESDVQVNLGSRTHDELTDLAEAFNRMTAQVAASMADQKEAISALVRTARLRDEFLSNFSHELNTPIASLIASLELAREGTLAPEDLPEASAQMLSDAQRLHSLVSNMLMVSRIESGNIEPVIAVVEAGQLISRLISTMDAAASFRVSGAPLNVKADSTLLEAAVRELLSNALLHGGASAEKPASVRLEKAGTFARILVQDQGPGVPTGSLPRLGEKYFRMDTSLTYARTGTGLGLFIARRLVQLQNGLLTFDSGPGLTAVVSLPG